MFQFIFKPIVAALCFAFYLPSFANVNFDNAPIATATAFELDKLKLDSIDAIGELSFNPPAMYRFDSHGVPVLFTPIDSLPMVDISLSFLAGSGHDDYAGRHGSANMVATMLTQGTQSLNEDDFIAKKEALAIALSADANKDSLTLSLRSLSDEATLDQAIDLMQEALIHPRFDGQVLARNQSQLITSIRQREQTPNYVASVAFNQAIFQDHPYAHPITGTSEDIAKLTVANLRAFAEQFLVADNAVITITGDLSQDKALAIANRLSHALPQGNKAPKIAVATAPTPQHIHINHPSPQTVVLMGNLTAPKQNDAQSLQAATNFAVANDVLAGGDFSARLMNEIRVNKGYTYGIYGSNQTWADAGMYAIRFSTQNARTQDAIEDTLKVIKDTQATGINLDELKLSVFNNKNSYPQNFASNASLHAIAKTMNIYELPQDFLATYESRFDKVNLNTANTALNTVIQPDNFVVVTVGLDKPNLDKLKLSQAAD